MKKMFMLDIHLPPPPMTECDSQFLSRVQLVQIRSFPSPRFVDY